jgi:pilus assembly protein Flp/PilA
VNKRGTMKKRKTFLKIWRDRVAQDLIEYALLAGFVAVAAGAIFPASIAPNISSIMSKVSSQLNSAPGN